MAKEGHPIYPLPEPMTARKDLDFSFSGLKTAAANKLKRLEGVPHDRQFVADFSASFEQAVIKHLLNRLTRAITLYSPKLLFLGGGVVSNVTLRQAARKKAAELGVKTVIPYERKLFTDNAGMIGVAAWYAWKRGGVASNPLVEREPNLNFPRI
jgi:N6-L-threonylcarbamoyladenine synthase